MLAIRFLVQIGAVVIGLVLGSLVLSAVVVMGPILGLLALFGSGSPFVIGMALGFCILVGTEHGGAWFRACIFCLKATGRLIRFALGRPVLEQTRPILKVEEHPRLFAVIREVAEAAKAPMPRLVILEDEVTAWVRVEDGCLALGLPLLQALTVSQFRAILAHEFAHVLDTSISEIHADEFAAGIVGSGAAVNALVGVHGASFAWDEFCQRELNPVLDAGRRPPVAEGFGRFLTSSHGTMVFGEAPAAETGETDSGSLGKESFLRDRIDALEMLPPGEVPDDDPPAISLIDDLERMEIRLLNTVLDPMTVESLEPIAWEEAWREIFLPEARTGLLSEAPVFARITVLDLGDVCRAPEELWGKPGDTLGENLSLDERRWLAQVGLGQALSVLLDREGWDHETSPGEEICFKRNGESVKPFSAMLSLTSGAMTSEAWAEFCEASGIADMSLAEGVLGFAEEEQVAS